MRLLALALLVLCAACGGKETSAGEAFVPVHPGVLTVATAFLPAPGFWQGEPPTRGGFEAGLATELAHRLGLARVRVVQVPFARIVSGHLGGVDLALSQLTPTDEREQVLDFSTPYLSAPAGVLARTGVEGEDLAALRSLHWVVSRASTLTPTVEDTIRPDGPVVETGDRADALGVLRAGQADALLLDLPVALGLARAEPQRFHVLAQLTGGEGLAAALPNGSHNLEILDSAIRHFQADGTIDRLVSRWLGTEEDDVPLIRTEG